jgi:hypothetical protein
MGRRGRSRVAHVTGALVALAVGLAGFANPAEAKPIKSHVANYVPPASTSAAQFSATVTLPSFTCTANNLSRFVSAQVLAVDTVNNRNSGAGVGLGCSKMGARKHFYSVPYFVAYVAVDGTLQLGQFLNPKLKAGDLVDLSTTCLGDVLESEVDDVTTGYTLSAGGTLPLPEVCTSGSPEIGLYGGADPMPIRGRPATTQFMNIKLPEFGAVQFTSILLDGLPLGTFNPVATNYFEGRRNQISVGALTSAGTAFTATQQ